MLNTVFGQTWPWSRRRFESDNVEVQGVNARRIMTKSNQDYKSEVRLKGSKDDGEACRDLSDFGKSGSSG